MAHFSTDAAIVGWAHSPFGKHDAKSVEEMIVEVSTEALAHAGIEPQDVDAIFIGHYNGGFVRQDFSSSLVLQADPSLRFTPSTRVENACATGSAAIHQGLNSIAAGQANRVLVVGVESMTPAGRRVPEILKQAAYLKEEDEIEAGFAGVFGKIAEAYFVRYGDQSDALAMIAAKNHANGVHNPYAQMRKALDYEFCRTPSEKNPIVAGPLKRTDCSLVSDGAAALVLASTDSAAGSKQAVGFKAAVQVNDFLPISRREVIHFEGPTEAWSRALTGANLTLDDLSFVETHDCFTIAELIEYEAMGLAERGQGHRVVADGTVAKGGKLPVNPSGGLKSKGHPIGATGVSMHVLTAMQLTGTAPEGMQVPGAQLGGIFNMGGAAVANYVSILEPR